MRISYASSSAIPSRFANSVNVMKMCHSFAKLGHQVVLYAPNVKGAEESIPDIYSWYGVGADFSVSRLPAPGYPALIGRVIYALSFGRAGLRPAPDLVYGRDWPALLIAAIREFPVVLEMHAPAPIGGVKRLLFGKLINHRNLLRVVVNSTALWDQVVDDFPQIKDRLVLARNGADPIPPPSTNGAPPLSRGEQRLTVGYTGHLYPGRGMEILGELAGLCPWADFHIVGGWPDDVALWRERLVGASNVRFHGYVPPGDVAGFLRAFDVLIAPYQPRVTLYGGQGDNVRWVCPIKLFEYMATGKPIVCSDLAVLREILVHDTDALLCPPTDSVAWAEALQRLRDDPGLRERLATTALAKFDRRYTWDARARNVLEGI